MFEKTKRVSCLIPAFNEAARIGKVLDAVVGHPWVDQIVVVDDASTDETLREARKYPVEVYALNENRGKSHAIMKALEYARNEIVLTLDADLIGLAPTDIDLLLAPVLFGEADVTVSLRKNTVLPYRLLGLDYISGERVFPRSLFPEPKKLETLRGFELEVYMNDLIITEKLRLRVVPWRDVIAPFKASKFGFREGMRGEVRMSLQILGRLGLIGIFSQIRGLRALRC